MADEETGKVGGVWASEALRTEQDAGLETPPRFEHDGPDVDPKDEPKMLSFESGATRNRKENELAYSGFLSPLALQMFARYMHLHRFTADGTVREPDNWQKGIPDESYIDSLLRHIMDLWLIYRGYPEAAREEKFAALSGAFFNIQGLMHNYMTEDVSPSEILESMLADGRIDPALGEYLGKLPAHVRDAILGKDGQ